MASNGWLTSTSTLLCENREIEGKSLRSEDEKPFDSGLHNVGADISLQSFQSSVFFFPLKKVLILEMRNEGVAARATLIRDGTSSGAICGTAEIREESV